jgi:translocation and assembly module TamB
MPRLSHVVSSLPPLPKRRKSRPKLGRAFARVLSFVLAIAGVLPIVAIGFIRSAYAREWAMRETAKALRDQGIVARFDVHVHLWPLSLELANVQVESSDGGGPALTARRATVHPRFFALMSGKLLIDQIDIDAPHARIVVKDGKLQNLALKPQETKKKDTGPIHLPFDGFAITDGDVDLTIDDVRVQAHELDLDVQTDDTDRGSSLEIALRAGESYVVRSREVEGADRAFDEDAVCTLDARVRVTPDDVTIRRFELTGAADLDPGKLTTPPCKLDQTDQRRVELELSHTRIKLPKENELPDVSGHVRARLPVGAAARVAKVPELEGWVGVDADVRFASTMQMPEVSGRVTAGGIRLDRYRFADYVDSELTIRDNVIKSPKTIVQLAGGTVHLKDVHVEPLAKTLGAAADIENVDFAALMIALGVAQHPHVGWDIVDIHMPVFSGTLDPLKLDGDFTATTKNFAVWDRWVKDPQKQRLIGFSEAKLGAHLAVRPDSVQFKNARGDLAHTHVDGGFVLLGFHNDLRVEVPHAHVGLQDITPLAGIPIAGTADVKVDVGPTMGDPKVSGDGKIDGFAIAGMPFGNILSVHAEVQPGETQVLALKNVKAQKNKSTYEMPSGRVEFGGEASMRMDASVLAQKLNLRDLLDVFSLNDDPRFDGIDGDLAGDTTFHFALGGKEDECGGGYISLHASPHLSNVDLYGEKFDDGDADLDLRWKDRAAGFAGTDLDVHAFTLHKVRREKDGATFGSLLGSASIKPGGILHGNVVLEGVPLSRLQTLGSIAPELEGTVSGLAQVGGTIDSFTADADVDVSPIHVRSGDLGASKLHVTMTQLPGKQNIIGKTACGAPLGGPFDKAAYVADTSSHGTYVVSGDMFGGQVHLDRITATRAKQMEVSGDLKLQKLALESLVKASGISEGSLAKLTGELTGDVTINNVKQGDYAAASARFVPKSLSIDNDGKKLVLKPTGAPIVLAGNKVALPPLELDLSAMGGVSGSVTLQGDVRDPFGDPTLDVRADLAPVDLSVLAGVVPKLDRATGSLSGSMRLTGRAADPLVEGDAKVRASELLVRGLPSPVNDVEIDLRADASEIRVARGAAKFAGGTLSLGGRVPIRNLGLGNVELTLGARNVRFAPADGISAGVDADLGLAIEDSGLDKHKLPHLTGEIMLSSLEYTRSINLAGDIGSLGAAKRTEVETYDPSQDAVTLDLRVRAKSPLRIKNNLVETQIQLDNVLAVTGTNQRFGLRGEMHAVPGGHLRLPFGNSVFDIQNAVIRFDDPSRIAAHVDIQAMTEYRRVSAQSTSGGTGSSASTTGNLWRITLHATGDTDNLKIELTSDPPLSQEDIVLLLTIGITRAEADQIQAGTLGAGIALEALSTITNASSAVTKAIPIIDDFKFGSAYSPHSGRTEPTVTVSKRISNNVSANVATTLSDERELYANVRWRLGQNFSIQGSYDNVNNDVTSSAVGNLGVDLRWRVEFK